MTNKDQRLQELLVAPDTIDLIVRRSRNLEEFIEELEDAAIGQILVGGNYAIVYASPKAIEEIIETLGTSLISSASLVLGTLDRASLELSGILQVQQNPFLDLTGRGVLMGFVDTGIDYTQECFRYEDGTSKIQYIWDQTAPGPYPTGFTLGKEYTNEQINAALASDNPYEIVPQRDNKSGHGTFIASVAAGRPVNGFIGVAPDSEIIMVKLRRARPFYLERYSVPEEQEDAFESNAIIVGVEYILEKARELGRPVSICIGLGTNQGSHSGFSLFEEYLANISRLRGVCLCAAAGNESQARHHMKGLIVQQGDIENIDIRVGKQADDFYVTIWNGPADRVSVSVRSPTGELVARLPARGGISVLTELILEPTVVLVEYYFPIEGVGSQLTVVKLINPTPGIWTIMVHGDIILNGTFHSWLPLTGFVSPSVQFLEPEPYFTITVPATMIGGAICCGAYDANTKALYINSSWGPTTLPLMRPDLVAPGVRVGGFYPYGPGFMDGTSVATSITSGAGALMLQWGIVDGNEPSMSTYQIRAYLIRGCDRYPGIVYPNEQWGYGSLNLIKTFNLMREL